MPSLLDYYTFCDGDESLIELAEKDYQDLLQLGQTAHAWRDPLHLPRFALVFSQANERVGSNNAFGYEAGDALAELLDHAVVVTPQAYPPHFLELIQPSPLRDLISLSIPTAISEKQSQKFEEFFTLLAPRTLKNMHHAAQSSIRKEGCFLGQLSVCVCGEPGCGAMTGWVENYTYLLTVESGGPVVTIKALLPAFLNSGLD